MTVVRLFIMRFFQNAGVVEFPANNFTVGCVRNGTR